VVPPASQFADISSLLSHRANRFASFGHGYHQYSWVMVYFHTHLILICLSYSPPFSTGVYHLRNLLKQVHAQRIRKVNLYIFVTSSVTQKVFSAYHAPYHHRMASCRPSDCMHHCLPCRILALHNPMACMCIFSSHIVDLKCQTDNALG
jgi:hypothetical protein